MLGRDRLLSFAFAGAQIGRMRQNQDGFQLAAVRFAANGQAMDSLRLWKNELMSRQPALTTGFTKVGFSGYLTYCADGLAGNSP